MSHLNFDKLKSYWGKSIIYTFPPITDPDEIYLLDDRYLRSIHFEGPLIDESDFGVPDWERGQFIFEFALNENYSHDEEGEIGS